MSALGFIGIFTHKYQMYTLQSQFSFFNMFKHAILPFNPRELRYL